MGIFSSSVSKIEKAPVVKSAPQKEAPKSPEPVKFSEPGVFGRTGWAEKRDVQKRTVAEYGKLKNIPAWQLESQKKEIFKKIFPEADKKTYFQKSEIDKQIRELENKLPYTSPDKIKDIRKQIEVLKKLKG